MLCALAWYQLMQQVRPNDTAAPHLDRHNFVSLLHIVFTKMLRLPRRERENPMNTAFQDTLLQLFQQVTDDPDRMPSITVNGWQEGSSEWNTVSAQEPRYASQTRIAASISCKLLADHVQVACFQLASGLGLLPQYASQAMPN